MIINATDLKNNLGKYLRACTKEKIIITSNGRKVATLCAYEEYQRNNTKVNSDDLIRERAEAFDDAPVTVSYEEFLALTGGNEKRYEYIDGEVYLLSSPKITHQKILGEMHVIFYNWFKGKKCRPMLAPFDITLKRSPDNINVVEPDIVVICDLEEYMNEKDYYVGTPVLVVEIISESTRSKDTIKKLDLYMSTGVNEYWIVNPLNKEITIYFFEQNDIVKNETYKKNEVAASYIFSGLKMNLKDIF
ncbi:MAG: type II toxin-antitoxin system Phd/YefM family antitoxin [Actinobacteria bacterium]|nr:type II toxin-antitoxin system Phd/YefM family antitoxin [Actinomycetota bacterium]